MKDIPLRRFGRVDEVAAVAVLLASNEASYMTGTEINIDGGLLAQQPLQSELMSEQEDSLQIGVPLQSQHIYAGRG